MNCVILVRTYSLIRNVHGLQNAILPVKFRCKKLAKDDYEFNVIGNKKYCEVSRLVTHDIKPFFYSWFLLDFFKNFLLFSAKSCRFSYKYNKLSLFTSRVPSFLISKYNWGWRPPIKYMVHSSQKHLSGWRLRMQKSLLRSFQSVSMRRPTPSFYLLGTGISLWS